MSAFSFVFIANSPFLFLIMPLGWLVQGRKIFPPPEFDPRTVQAVASYYNDYAIPDTKHQDTQVNILKQTTRNISKIL